ncbi:Signal peptidase I [hydrothermal vent metagenome]|uniref:signal peptidase I n=1 Tax=hydrothermal vent metagenome TaxID=652676 RepID=A0A3B0ZLL6_9ZZZZ
MNFDFQGFMLLLLVVSGVLWALDYWKWAPKRREAEKTARAAMKPPIDEKKLAEIFKEPTYVEYAKSFFPIILIVFVMRSFLVEPFRIPSGSMMPTLLVGDFILVNKFTYGIRLPVAGSKILDLGEPERGDVVVFRFPKDPSLDYIKRVVGLPGDRVGYFNKTIYINGKPVAQEETGRYVGIGSGFESTGASLRNEKLGEAEHQILIDIDQRAREGEVVVPEGEYFVMGDNRDRSNDSRFWGTVPEDHLVGKAFMVWMNWDSSAGGVTWGRIGNSID